MVVTFESILHHGCTLSDGFETPPGTFVDSPSRAIAADAEVYPKPEVFDSWRYEKTLEAVEKNASAAGRTKWALANLDNIAFEYGRHTCPGQFFADYEIKFIMANLLMTDDIEYGQKQKGRLANVKAETQMIADHEAKIRMRRRHD